MLCFVLRNPMLKCIHWIRSGILHTSSGLGRSTVVSFSTAREVAQSIFKRHSGYIYSLSSLTGNNMASDRQSSSKSSFPPQLYHNFLVLDFEATCDKELIKPQEIIEFPVVRLHGRTLEIQSVFHTYVQPEAHPQLTPFCTELTGIVQSMVDGQPTLQRALQMVDEWMKNEGLLDPNVNSIFVTCGDWDLRKMLPGQCQYLKLPVPDYFKKWINLKKAYGTAMETYPKSGLPCMVEGLALSHIGRLHSGIDDCKNIANIMKELARKGFIFKETGSNL
uniref:ERI1 exoribonuclease family member 3 n=1 Tax=Callorhinchus milii TaxID=7868 RepID=A0A4W3HZQ0_CALMI|eukprot:gi/632963826/ref/XP_007898099.1/ PREDICTED: ERI1 exoribonuclease 3 [Callorhinchus milii]